jgi:hypothetical protein
MGHRLLRTLLILGIGYAAGTSAPALAEALQIRWNVNTEDKTFDAILNAFQKPDHVSKLVLGKAGVAADGQINYSISFGGHHCAVTVDTGNTFALAAVNADGEYYTLATKGGAPVSSINVSYEKIGASRPPASKAK